MPGADAGAASPPWVPLTELSQRRCLEELHVWPLALHLLWLWVSGRRNWRLPGPGAGKGDGVEPSPGSQLRTLSLILPHASQLRGSPSPRGRAVTSPPASRPSAASPARPGPGSPLPPLPPAAPALLAPQADLSPRRPQLQLQLRLPARPDQPKLHAVVRPGEEPGPGGHADAVAAHGAPQQPRRGDPGTARFPDRPGLLAPQGQFRPLSDGSAAPPSSQVLGAPKSPPQTSPNLRAER